MSDENQALIEVHGESPESTPEECIAVGKAMLIVLGSGGPLSAKEMERFLSIAAAYDAAPEAVDELKRFDYANASLSDHFKGDARLGRHLMYDAIRILRADGDRAHQRVRAKEAARLLGVDPSIVASLESIVEAEEALRHARAVVEDAVNGRANGAPIAVAAGLKEITGKEAALRRTRLSLMDEGKGAPASAA
jgi:hypothetical protein